VIDFTSDRQESSQCL